MNLVKKSDGFTCHLVLITALIGSFLCSVDVSAQEFKFLELTVLDENGKPMPEVTVDVRMDGLKFPMSTDELGMISLNISPGRNPVEFRIRQTGYEYQRVRWSRASEVPAEHSIKMQPGKPNQGWVLDTQGNPVAGAEVFAAPPDKSLTFVNGKNPPKSKQVAVKTDEQGKFTLPFQPEGATIAGLSDAGWAQFEKTKKQRDQPLEIKLSHWVTVELLTKFDGKQLGGDKVGLHFLSAMEIGRGKVEWHYQGVTNEQGQFICNRVIPGNAMAYREVPLKLVKAIPAIPNRSHGHLVQLKPGVRMQVLIGGAKQKATGKFFKPVAYDGKVNWQSGYVVLTENNAVDLGLRTLMFEYGKLLGQSGVMDPTQRVPPTMQPNYLVRYISTVQPDGSFEIDNVPPGQYTLSAALAAQPKHDPNQTDVLSLEDLSFSIMATEDDEPFDLGEHILDYEAEGL